MVSGVTASRAHGLLVDSATLPQTRASVYYGFPGWSPLQSCPHVAFLGRLAMRVSTGSLHAWPSRRLYNSLVSRVERLFRMIVPCVHRLNYVQLSLSFWGDRASRAREVLLLCTVARCNFRCTNYDIDVRAYASAFAYASVVHRYMRTDSVQRYTIRTGFDGSFASLAVGGQIWRRDIGGSR